MKIIKIETCSGCPLSDVKGHSVNSGKLIFKCVSAANLDYEDVLISVDDLIPEWCPLDDSEEC